MSKELVCRWEEFGPNEWVYLRGQQLDYAIYAANVPEVEGVRFMAIYKNRLEVKVLLGNFDTLEIAKAAVEAHSPDSLAVWEKRYKERFTK